MVWQQEQRLPYENFLEKHNIILLMLFIFFLLLSFKLLHLQVLRGSHYKTVSEQQRTQVVLERAPRGTIYDCNAKIIVENKTAFVALFYPFSQDIKPPEELLKNLNNIFKIQNLSSKIIHGWRTGQIVRLAENLTREEMFKIQEQRLVLPGISVVKESRREYVYPEANSHLAGYINEITKSELEQLKNDGYKLGDWIGRRGLEKTFDSSLKGKDGGWEIEVDAQGRQTRLVRHISSSVGNTLYTTIDTELQKVAYDELKKTKTGRGAVVGIDPKTGAVRILVSSPGFDPGVAFTKAFAAYLKDKDLPLFDRAIMALYPPGSLFKIVTLSAAINENKSTPDKTYFCNGSFMYGSKSIACWEKRGHGQLNLIGAITRSCNVYFYQLGLKIGEEVIENYAKKFYINKPSEIELPSEKTGLVPSPKWKKEKLNKPWLPGDTINMSIGQGYLWVTPMEMAVMMMAVANSGPVYKPYLVDKIVTLDGEEVFKYQVQKKGEVVMKNETWELLHFGLKNVVKEGTAQWCQFKNLAVAGKTGTAQNPHGEDHAWFGAYAPADNPELAIVVLVENGGHGGGVAAPIARAIFKKAFPEQTAGEW